MSVRDASCLLSKWARVTLRSIPTHTHILSTYTHTTHHTHTYTPAAGGADAQSLARSALRCVAEGAMAMQRASRGPPADKPIVSLSWVCVCGGGVWLWLSPFSDHDQQPEPEDERQRVLRVPLSPAGRPESPSDLIFPPDSLVSSRPATDTAAWLLPFLNLPQKTQQQHSRRRGEREKGQKKEERKKNIN